MGLLALTFLYVAYILASAMICRVIGKGRFYIVRYRVAEIDNFHSRYGAWVGKMFAILLSVGFFSLMIKTAFFKAADAIAYAANDWTEAPYFMAVFGFVILSVVLYYYLTKITKSSELKFNFPKKLNFTVRSEEKDGKTIIDAWDIYRAMRQAKRAMTQTKGELYNSKTGLDLIDISARGELKRILDRATRYYPFSKVPWLIERQKAAQAEIRIYPTASAATAGSLVIKVGQEEVQQPVTTMKSKSEQADLEEQLNLQLSALSETDRKLVREYIFSHPGLMQHVLSAGSKVIFDLTEDEHGRRVGSWGVTVRRCANK